LTHTAVMSYRRPLSLFKERNVKEIGMARYGAVTYRLLAKKELSKNRRSLHISYTDLV